MTATGENPDRNFTALVADDHEYVRNWLRDELQKNFPNLSAIRETGNVRDAISQAVSLKPDVICLDIDFADEPSVNGIDAAEQIWKQHEQAAIIIVSNHKGEVYVRHLYKITPVDGAYGYVLKDKVTQSLVPAVKAVLSGDCWLDPDITRIVNRLVRSDHTLTDNEYEALVCIALGLSDQTSGRLLCITEKAIQARLQLLYAKFGIAPKGDPNAGVFNPRCRAVWCGVQRGLINESELKAWASELGKKAKELSIELNP